jgi:hypothetical protein
MKGLNGFGFLRIVGQKFFLVDGLQTWPFLSGSMKGLKVGFQSGSKNF